MKIAILCALAGLSVPSIASAACQQTPRAYNEPAQRLDQGVQRVAHRSGCFVNVDLARYGARRTAPLKGNFAPRDALTRMVRPAGLLVAKGANGTGYQLTPPHAAKQHAGRVEPLAARNGGDERLEKRIHQHAAMIDRRIDAAVAAGRLSSDKAAQLHQQVGQVQVEAGHAGRTQGALSTEQASAFEATLAGIETVVPQHR